MLVIRREQMQVFDEYASKGFEDRLVRYFAGRFPDVCGEKEEASVRETIRKGIERSKGYGITTEFDVARYIELMYLFSEDFDTNPETSWAAPVLGDTDLGGNAKMDRLCEEAAQRADDLEFQPLTARRAMAKSSLSDFDNHTDAGSPKMSAGLD